MAGRRVTDAATLEVMKYVVAGKVNVDLLRAAARGRRHAGRPARRERARRPRHAAAAAGAHRRRRPSRSTSASSATSIGFNLGLLGDLWERRYVPVLACLGMAATGGVYNINADTVANQLAGALRADALVLVTSTPGVLRDVDDPASRMPRMTRADCERGVADGSISGGMIPKLEEASPCSRAARARSSSWAGSPRASSPARCSSPGSVGTVLSAE